MMGAHVGLDRDSAERIDRLALALERIATAAEAFANATVLASVSAKSVADHVDTDAPTGPGIGDPSNVDTEGLG